MVLAIDIGNTRVHLGIIDTDNLRCISDTALKCSETDTKFPDSISKLTKNYSCSHIFLASVNRPCAELIEKIIVTNDFGKITKCLWKQNLPVNVNYNNPATLGVDRIADCLYARAAFPNTTSIIVNAGTAIKIDILDFRNNFLGGAILPGIQTQLNSLHIATDALPDISHNPKNFNIPGTSTIECMSAGVVYGAAGAVNFIVNKYQKSFNVSQVITTGGAWGIIAPHITFDFKYIAEMTLIGTALF